MPADRRMTDAEIRRKTNKPIMEKKRRERINKCLEDLKAIVLTSVTDENRPNKLEKADILEMTVRYLKSVQGDKPSAIRALPTLNQSEDRLNLTESDPVLRHKGYAQCVHEVTSFLSKSEGVPVGFRTQLLGHLADKYNPVPEDKKLPKKHQRNSREPYVKPTAMRPLNNGFITELDIQRQGQLQSTRIEETRTPVKINTLYRYRHGPMMHPSRFSPIPVSPISSSSHVSLRHIPSPSLSASSHRSDLSIDTTNNNTDSILYGAGVSSACFSPSDKVIPERRFRLTEATHYTSSDSGNWSSGSSPPSPIPIPATTMKLTMQATCGNFNKSIKVENTVPQMWRPWGL